MTPRQPSSFCFVHCADLHLDTPFRGLHEIAPKVAAELREASLDAFDTIVNLCLEREAAFLLVGGDVYDGAERGLRAQLRFRDALGRLSDAGIPSFVVHGNHDPVLTGWSAVGSWPSGVTIFPTERTDVVEVIHNGEHFATVQGISYATAETTENLALRMRRPDGAGLHVGVLHCNVQGVAEGYANYSPCTLDDLRRTGLDYLALGHIHQRRILAGERGKGPWVVYSGNSQARSPRRTEQEPKGAVVVHVLDGAVDEVEFVACDRVRYAEIEVSIEKVEDLGELGDLLEQQAREARVSAENRSIVLRARLVGRGRLHQDLVRPSVIAELTHALRDRESEESPFCWWDALADETSAALDLDELRRRGDFAADLLALTDSLLEDADGRSALLDSLLEDAPRFLVENARSVLADDARAADLLSRAGLLALDQIVDGAA